ncbi:hypothetical protein G9A89_004485 [Geosiphon pyriformis]|nr:hypothetical protein G9A89_004485 [Geosiphon pyriformis]
MKSSIEMESTVPPPVSGAANDGAWENVNGHQRFSGWVASNLVPGATFKIKMALLGSLFQLLPGCIGLNATKVAISDEVFLTTLKIARSSDVVSVSFPSLSVALCNISLGTSSNDIKTAFGIFGVVTSVKLKPAGLWQYAVVNFKDISSAAAALFNWSVLVRKDSVRIFPVANQKEVISLRDAFKAKLVNLSFGCTAFEIIGGRTCFILYSPESYQCQHFAVVTFDSLESLNVAVSKTGTLHGCCIWWETPGCRCCYRCQDLNYLAVDYKKLPPLPPKLSSNTFDGPKNFKSSFVESKSYAKAAVFVVPSGAAAANMELDLGGSPKTTTPVLPAVSSVPNTAVESRLAFLESHLNELSVLIKSLVEPVGALVAVDVSVKECIDGLAKQNKGLAAVATVMQKRLTRLETISERICLENG